MTRATSLWRAASAACLAAAIARCRGSCCWGCRGAGTPETATAIPATAAVVEAHPAAELLLGPGLGAVQPFDDFNAGGAEDDRFLAQVFSRALDGDRHVALEVHVGGAAARRAFDLERLNSSELVVAANRLARLSQDRGGLGRRVLRLARVHGRRNSRGDDRQSSDALELHGDIILGLWTTVVKEAQRVCKECKTFKISVLRQFSGVTLRPVKVKWPSAPKVLTALLVVLLPVLAFMQYRWVGQVSEGERDDHAAQPRNRRRPVPRRVRRRARQATARDLQVEHHRSTRGVEPELLAALHRLAEYRRPSADRRRHLSSSTPTAISCGCAASTRHPRLRSEPLARCARPAAAGVRDAPTRPRAR